MWCRYIVRHNQVHIFVCNCHCPVICVTSYGKKLESYSYFTSLGPYEFWRRSGQLLFPAMHFCMSRWTAMNEALREREEGAEMRNANTNMHAWQRRQRRRNGNDPEIRWRGRMVSDQVIVNNGHLIANCICREVALFGLCTFVEFPSFFQH